MLLYYLRLITISFMKCLILDFRFYGFIVFVLIYKFIDGMVNKKNWVLYIIPAMCVVKYICITTSMI